MLFQWGHSKSGAVQLIKVYKGYGEYTISADDVKKYKHFLCISSTGATTYIVRNTFSVTNATIETLKDESVFDGNSGTSNSLICYLVSDFKAGSIITSNHNGTWRYIGEIFGIS